MIHPRSIITVVMLALCVVAQAQVPATGPKTKEQPVTGTIDGKVVNENGQPLAGAAVFVRTLNAGINRSTSTDLDGNFRVNGLETGIYTVVANSPAYTSVPADPDAPNYYRLGDSARVELVRGGAITGTVTNAIGEPVIAVRVRAILVRDAKGQVARSPGFMEQPTDDRGIYRIYGLSAGRYRVSVGSTEGGFMSRNRTYYALTFYGNTTDEVAAVALELAEHEIGGVRAYEAGWSGWSARSSNDRSGMHCATGRPRACWSQDRLRCRSFCWAS